MTLSSETEKFNLDVGHDDVPTEEAPLTPTVKKSKSGLGALLGRSSSRPEPEPEKCFRCDKMKHRNTNLQKSLCESRENSVSHVSYNAELTLPKGKYYYGVCTLGFDLDLPHSSILPKAIKKKQKPSNLIIDFAGLEIYSVKINGCDKAWEKGAIEFNDHALQIPTKYLAPENAVEVVYKNEYSNSGCGLHSYTDPADGEQYVYTFFESHYCHEVFPTFDQPNLKAAMTLTLNAHESWAMISNEDSRVKTTYDTKEEWEKALPHPLLAKSEFAEGKITRWEFFATPKLSSYLYAFCGGNYDCIEGPKDLVTPMKLYFRRSVKQYVTQEYADEWFKASDHATRFFADYMNVAYPYSKMDHIIVPEFNMGAMEQVGCITYTEKYLFKVPPSRSRRINVTNTIIHEIAHQWFGNLVTMHWWDDLWLNEAFATYMACEAQTTYTDTKGVLTGSEAWLNLVNDANWGLREDQGSETHPIACIAKDTVEAETIFDGISYGKGSAFLKTWMKYSGREAFQAGVRDYFARYMGSNASLRHFVKTQEDAADPALGVREWAESWLKTKGAMEVTGKLRLLPKDRTIESFTVHQSFCSHADEVYKKHRMDVAFFYAKDGGELEKKVFPVLVEAAASTEITELKGLDVPDAVMINAEMHTYCKAVNDARSNDFLLKNYAAIGTPLDKYVFICQLREQIRDGKYPALKFLKEFETTLSKETNGFLREAYLRFAREFLEMVSEEHYDKYAEKLYQLFKSMLGESVANAKKAGVEPEHGQCATALVGYCLDLIPSTSELLVVEGKAVLTSKELAGYPLADSHIFDLLPDVCSLKEWQAEEREKLIEDMLKAMPQDKMSDVDACRRQCEAAIPTLENKQKIWEILINPPEELSQVAYGDYAGHFCSKRHPDLMAPFVDGFFDNALRIHKEKVHFFSIKFMFNVMPSNVYRDDMQYSDRLEKLAKAAGKDADQMFKTNIAKLTDRDSRRVAGRKLTDPSLW